MPVHPDMIEMLIRSPLLADVSAEIRSDLALRFETRPFTSGQTLIADGAGGRALLEILTGTADVFVRERDHRYRVATLEPGGLVGEGAFFSGTPRAADVIGSSEGIVAVLPWDAYMSLVQAGHPGAEAIERAVVAHLTRRVKETNARLSALLDAQRSGGLKNALSKFFGITTPAPVVNHD